MNWAPATLPSLALDHDAGGAQLFKTPPCLTSLELKTRRHTKLSTKIKHLPIVDFASTEEVSGINNRQT